MFVADVVFGSLLTLVAALPDVPHRPRWSALVVPVVVNGLGVAADARRCCCTCPSG